MFLVRKFVDIALKPDEILKIKKENLPSPWDVKDINSGLFSLFASNIIKVDEVFGSKIRKFPSEDTLRYFLQKIREENFTNLVVNLTPSEKHLRVDEYYKIKKVNAENNEIALRALKYDRRLSKLEAGELFPLLKSIYSFQEVLGFYIDEPFPKEFSRLEKISNEFNNTKKENYFLKSCCM